MNRFTDTNKWSEDWYCELKGEYQKLWDYICDHCDNAGIWKPNKIDFEIKTGFTVNLGSFFNKVNGDKQRILALANGRWLIPGFIQYQWFNKQESFDLALSNRLHNHIYELLKKNGAPFEKIRGLREVLERSNMTSKDKDKVKDGKEESVREEKPDLSESNLFRKPKKPTYPQVAEVFFRHGGTEEMAKKFFETNEATGWFYRGSPIVKFESMISPYISAWKANNGSQGEKKMVI